VRDRTGHKSNALLTYEKPGTEQVLKVSECLGVPSNLNLSKDNVALPSSDGAGMAEAIIYIYIYGLELGYSRFAVCGRVRDCHSHAHSSRFIRAKNFSWVKRNYIFS
jgi:hypothetical protein